MDYTLDIIIPKQCIEQLGLMQVQHEWGGVMHTQDKYVTPSNIEFFLMMLQRLNDMRKKLIKIQIANYVTGIITSIIWSVLFYYACVNTGNSRDFINMFFPALLFVISVVGSVSSFSSPWKP